MKETLQCIFIIEIYDSALSLIEDHMKEHFAITKQDFANCLEDFNFLTSNMLDRAESNYNILIKCSEIL